MTSQHIRNGSGYGGRTNPYGLFEYVKPSRIIIVTEPPEADVGEDTWYAIDSTTGVLYYKPWGSLWQGIYDFGGGGGGGTITGARNIGLGEPVFKNVDLGGILQFRTLIGITRGDQVGVEIVRNNFAPGLDNELELSVPRSINNVVDGTAGDASIIKDLLFDVANKGTLELRTLKAGSGIEIGLDGQDRILIEASGIAGTTDFYSTYLTIPLPVLTIPPNSANQIITITDALSVPIFDPDSEWEILQSNIPPLGGNMIFRYNGLNGHSYRTSIDVTVNTAQQSGSGVPIIIQFFIRIRDGGGVLVYDLPPSSTTVMFPGTDSNVITFASGSSTFIIQPIQNYTYTIHAIFRSTSPVFIRTYQIEKLNMTLSKVK